MNGEKQDFPHRVGFGLFKENMTIEEEELAAFVNLNDAEKYIKTRIDNDLFSSQKVFYIDTQVQDGSSMLTVRYIYDNKQHKLIEGNEVLSGKSDIYITGYEVFADYEDEEGNYDYTEHIICLSDMEAQTMKQKFFEDGAAGVNIEDTDNIGIKHYFWGSGKFLRGDADNDRVGKIISDMRNTPFKQGETVAQRVGTVLDEVSTEEMMRYFEKHVLGGAGLIRNYLETQIINDEIGRLRAAQWKQYDEMER